MNPLALAVVGCVLGVAMAGCPFAPAYENGQAQFSIEEQLKAQLIKNKYVLDAGQPGASAFGAGPVPTEFVDSQNKATTLLLAKQFYVQNVTIQDGYNLDYETIFKSIEDTIPIEQRCAAAPVCNDADVKYRRVDGYCNSLTQSKWGGRNTPYGNIRNPKFADGVFSLRVDSNNAEFPQPRELGNYLFQHSVYKDVPTNLPNLAAIMIGQYIAHDLGLRQPIQGNAGGPGLSCCTRDSRSELPNHLSYFGCKAFMAPKDDKYYKTFDMPCATAMRSQTTLDNDCSIKRPAFVNTVSHFLDNSNIYSSNPDVAKMVRSFQNGQLAIVDNLAARIPGCVGDAFCFFFGDIRGTGITTLAVLHTLFLRQHNSIATGLCALNQSRCDNDEQVFQDARRIQIAIYQNLLVNEWLPLMLGNETATRRVSCPAGSASCATSYDPAIDPSSLNEFSHSAFRVFHQLVPATTSVYDANYTKIVTMPMNATMIGMGPLRGDGYENFLRGMLHDPVNTGKFPDVLRNNIFSLGVRNDVGVDLLLTDIFRGRDHGFTSYVDYLKLATNETVKQWSDLKGIFSHKTLRMMTTVYPKPEDLELTVGMFLEEKLNGYTGPVLKFIMEEQFHRMQTGDRFYYTHKNVQNPFTDAQLQEINRISFAHILCANTKIGTVNVRSFEIASATNKPVNCNALTPLNLSLF